MKIYVPNINLVTITEKECKIIRGKVYLKNRPQYYYTGRWFKTYEEAYKLIKDHMDNEINLSETRLANALHNKSLFLELPKK